MDRLTVASQLDASIWQVKVAVGDRVEAGQNLVILECMKTEIPATAPRAGVVAEILVEQGEQVRERQPLVVLTV